MLSGSKIYLELTQYWIRDTGRQSGWNECNLAKEGNIYSTVLGDWPQVLSSLALCEENSKGSLISKNQFYIVKKYFLQICNKMAVFSLILLQLHIDKMQNFFSSRYREMGVQVVF